MVERLKKVLKSASGPIKICGHKNIDADSLLSMLLLRDFFCFLGFEAIAVVPDPVVEEQPIITAKELSICLNSLYGSIGDDDCLFLVDCHASEYSKNILGCIDHHPTSECISFPFVINERATSTTMLIIELMEQAGMKCVKEQYVYAVYGAYLDTLALKSVKTNKKDIPWLEEKIDQYEIDRERLIYLALGINDQSRPPEQLARIGYKEYTICGIRISTSFIMYESIANELKEKIIKYLKQMVDNSDINLWIYFFCDPIHERSEVVEIDKRGITSKKYDRIISRGIDIVPALEKRFSSKSYVSG